MKKAIFLVMILSATIIIYAQENPEFRDSEPFWYVYMEFKDYTNLSQLSEKINMLLQETANQGIPPQGPLFFYFYEPSPEDQEMVPRWGFGFQILEDATVQVPLKKAEYPYRKIASITRVGPFESLSVAFNIIMPFIEENGFEQAGLTIINTNWLDNPDAVESENCRLEIIVPVKKVRFHKVTSFDDSLLAEFFSREIHHRLS